MAVVRSTFEDSYRRRFAFLMPNQSLVIESVSVESIAPGEGERAAHAPAAAPTAREASADALVSMYCFADEEPAGRRAARLFEPKAWP